MSIVIITGTGTGVGKTVVTAAIAALAVERGAPVAVVKPAQTGLLPGEPGDLTQIGDLSGAKDLHELARYPDPLSPEAAARRRGLPEVDLQFAAERIKDLADLQQLVLVEGAGGLLVRYTTDGATLADLARMLSAPVLVVVDAGLGTLNATALTLEALAHRGLQLSGLVVGSWPAVPDLACLSNLEDLTALAARPLLGLLPANIGSFSRASFVTAARAGLGPSLGGTFDATEFLRSHRQ
jgi:dethiobiotin synthetase